MTAIYGPAHWKAKEAGINQAIDEDRIQNSVEWGRVLWALTGEEPTADTFWDVIAPMMIALAAESPEKAGYGEGFNAASALEQLMHEIAHYREQALLSLVGNSVCAPHDEELA